MDVNNQCILRKKIKYCLVFFCIISFNSCVKNTTNEVVTVNYENAKAVAISFASEVAIDSYSVFVNGNNDTPVLGVFSNSGNDIVFTPIIPFSKGRTYILKKQGGTITEFKIDTSSSEAPEVLALYPSTDTIPENLLKLYVVFSKPMQEVQSALDFIEVYNETDNQPAELFLTLENELWNAEHTELTLWLDPGRIKTDLIPNRTKGLPITAGKTYSIRIKEQWKDAEGNMLKKSYTKTYDVVTRDRIKPNPKQWAFQLPAKGTQDSLIIDFNEPLDAMLVLETLQISNTEDAEVKGNFQLFENEYKVVFYPKKAWEGSNYKLVIASRLEDLAGNNINHLFDKDLKTSKQDNTKAFMTRDFKIE